MAILKLTLMFLASFAEYCDFFGFCELDYIGDGSCTTSCMSEDCSYDSTSVSSNLRTIFENSDCYAECLEKCADYKLGDGKCDRECDIEQCIYDLNDCESCGDSFCWKEEIGDGECKDDCYNEECEWDGGDCEYCAEECSSNELGNDQCDDVCDTSSCDYDNGYCGCSDDCKVENYGTCHEGCLVTDCSFDPNCSDNYTKFKSVVKYLLLLESYSDSDLDDDCSNCTQDDLTDGYNYVCKADKCTDKYCLYQLGGCSNANGCAQDCIRCANNRSDICFECANYKVHFFGQCLDLCPAYYKAIDLCFQDVPCTANNKYRLCVPDFYDYSTAEDPQIFYVKLNPEEVGDSTFSTLEDALSSAWKNHTVIKLEEGEHSITRTILQEDRADKPYLTIESDTTAVIKLKITDFQFPKYLTSLTFRNVIIDGSQAIKNDCSADLCKYCPYFRESNSVFYNDRGETISDITTYNKDECSSLTSKAPISGSFDLHLENSEIREMRYKLNAVIEITNNNVLINDTKFANVSAEYDSSSAVINVICNSGECGDFKFEMQGGSVEFVNNGFEYRSGFVQYPFVKIEQMRTVKFDSVEFKGNALLCDPDCLGFLVVQKSFAFNMTNCKFESSFFMGSLLSFDNKAVILNYLVDINQHIMCPDCEEVNVNIENNQINNVVSKVMFSIREDKYANNVQIRGNTFTNSMGMDLIDIENDSASTEHDSYDLNYLSESDSEELVELTDRFTIFELNTYQEIIFNVVIGLYNRNFIDLNPSAITLSTANGDPHAVIKIYKDLPESYMLNDISVLPIIDFGSFLTGDRLGNLNITCNVSVSEPINHFFDLTLIYGKITILSSSFSNVKGSLISVTGSDSSTFEINESNFTDISGNYIIYTDDIENVTMNNLVFSNIEVENVAKLNRVNDLEIYGTSVNNTRAETGSQGALNLNLDAADESTIIIMNSNFTLCESKTDGGVIYVTSSYQDKSSVKLLIENSRFEQNDAEYSGSVLYFNSYIHLIDSSISSSYFIKNSGNSDGTLRLYDISGELEIKNCVFDENKSNTEIYIMHINSDNQLEMVINETNFTRNDGLSTIFAQCRITDIIEINNSSFEQNKGTTINFKGCKSETNHNHFFLNEASEGLIMLDGESELEMDESIFESNISQLPSAIILKYSTFEVRNSYFIANSQELIDARLGSALIIENSHIYNHQSSSNALININNNSTAEINNSEIYLNSVIASTIIVDTAELKMREVKIHNNTAVENMRVINGKIDIETTSISDMNSFSVSFIHATAVSEVAIRDSSFRNSMNSMTAFRIEYSTLTVEDCLFEEIESLEGGTIYSVESDLEINNSHFSKTYTGLAEWTIFVSYGTLLLSESIIEHFDRSAIYIEFSDLTILNSTFSNGERGINGYDLSLFNVQDSTFSNLNGANGGGMYLSNEQTFNVDNGILKNSIFYNNSATNGGGLYAQNFNLLVEECTFSFNSALNLTLFNPFSAEITEGKGGGICFESTRSSTIEVKNSVFTNNSAPYNGGAISYSGTVPVFENVTFEFNTAYYGPDRAGYATKVLQLDFDGNVIGREIKESALESVTPGQIIDPFSLAVVDDLDQVVTTDNSNAIGFRSNNDATISGTTSVEISQGVANFTNIVILATPGTSVYLEADCDKVDVVTGSPIVPISISLDLMDCVPGEVTKEDECQLCLESTYSLDPADDLCRACPDTAYCYGEDKIVPLKNYWRSSEYSHKIWECPIPDTCLGGLEDEDGEISRTGRCREGHMGNMCQSCEKDYMHNALSLCGDCPDFTVNVVLLSFSILGLCLVLVIVVSVSLSTAKEAVSLHSVYIKIFINYIQLVSLVATFDLKWPSVVRTFLSYFTVVNGASDALLSFECFIGDQEDGYYSKLAIMAVSPLVMGLIALGVWLTISLIKREFIYMKRELVATWVVLLFLLHPTVVTRLFSSLNCMEIEEGEYWLSDHREIKCWESTHYLYIFGFSVPGLLLWGLLFPTLCLIYLYKNSNNLEGALLKMQFGFLYNGFTAGAYFWEFTILFRKFLIIICSVFVKKISVMVQALCMLIIVLVSLYIHEKFKPFRETPLNVMEKRSNLVCLMTIFCGLFYLTEDLGEIAETVLFFMILFMNLYFFESWIIKLFKSAMLYLEKYSWFRKFFKRRIQPATNIIQPGDLSVISETNNMKDLFMNALRTSVNRMQIGSQRVASDYALNIFAPDDDGPIPRAKSAYFN